MPKLNIKMEPQNSSKFFLFLKLNFFFYLFFFFEAFGLPPTPPSSLPSDESEGNQSPEHRLSPMSSPIATATSSRRSSTLANNNSNSSAVNSRIYSGSSTRQPIHTPLISSQPVSFFFP